MVDRLRAQLSNVGENISRAVNTTRGKAVLVLGSIAGIGAKPVDILPEWWPTAVGLGLLAGALVAGWKFFRDRQGVQVGSPRTKTLAGDGKDGAYSNGPFAGSGSTRISGGRPDNK